MNVEDNYRHKMTGEGKREEKGQNTMPHMPTKHPKIFASTTLGKHTPSLL
jgi:hypothetical protein